MTGATYLILLQPGGLSGDLNGYRHFLEPLGGIVEHVALGQETHLARGLEPAHIAAGLEPVHTTQLVVADRKTLGQVADRTAAGVIADATTGGKIV
jgi:hypothetical protein